MQRCSTSATIASSSAPGQSLSRRLLFWYKLLSPWEALSIVEQGKYNRLEKTDEGRLIMIDRRNQKLAEKYREKQNWKKETADLLAKRQKAEAQLKGASEIIAKVQKVVKDDFDASLKNPTFGGFNVWATDIAKIVGVDIPDVPEPEPAPADEAKEA